MKKIWLENRKIKRLKKNQKKITGGVGSFGGEMGFVLSLII